MQVGDLVTYIGSSRSHGEFGIILDKEYECYQEDTYKIYWFCDCECDWWDGSDLEVISASV